MNGWTALEHFLHTDPIDAGCDETMQRLDVYAELVLANGEAEQRYPGIAVHLRVCGPCAEDLEGLLVALRESPDAAPAESSS